MKKWYILFRCLVHANQGTDFQIRQFIGLSNPFNFQTAATTRSIEVWLPNDSKDREFLLKVRGCQFAHEELNKIFTERVESVEKALESFVDEEIDNQSRLDMCKDWYFYLRKTYEDNGKSYLDPKTWLKKTFFNRSASGVPAHS